MKTKLLFFDIENAPSLGWFYDLWKEGNIVGTKAEQYFLSFAYKWQGEKIKSFSLPDFKGYKPGSEDDKALVKELWKLFDEADILIAHNGDGFDVKKANARFAFYNLSPPSPYKTVDTLKIARRYFKFTSNKLDELGNYLGYGRKLAHTGFHLWKGCMTGDPKSWKHMVEYNKRDIVLLEQIYRHFLPWDKSHNNLAEDGVSCPKCNSKKLQSRGTALRVGMEYQRYQCLNCGSWAKGASKRLYKPLVSV